MLKPHEEGGEFAPETIAEHRPRIAELQAHVDTLRNTEAGLLERVCDAQRAAREAALAAVLSQVPAHKQDLQLLEAVGKCQADAKRYV